MIVPLGHAGPGAGWDEILVIVLVVLAVPLVPLLLGALWLSAKRSRVDVAEGDVETATLARRVGSSPEGRSKQDDRAPKRRR